MAKRKPKSMRDDPKVQEITTLLMAGRHSERMDIVEEIDRRIATYPTDQSRFILRSLKAWLEARG